MQQRNAGSNPNVLALVRVSVWRMGRVHRLFRLQPWHEKGRNSRRLRKWNGVARILVQHLLPMGAGRKLLHRERKLQLHRVGMQLSSKEDFVLNEGNVHVETLGQIVIK